MFFNTLDMLKKPLMPTTSPLHNVTENSYQRSKVSFFEESLIFIEETLANCLSPISIQEIKSAIEDLDRVLLHGLKKNNIQSIDKTLLTILVALKNETCVASPTHPYEKQELSQSLSQSNQQFFDALVQKKTWSFYGLFGNNSLRSFHQELVTKLSQLLSTLMKKYQSHRLDAFINKAHEPNTLANVARKLHCLCFDHKSKTLTSLSIDELKSVLKEYWVAQNLTLEQFQQRANDAFIQQLLDFNLNTTPKRTSLPLKNLIAVPPDSSPKKMVQESIASVVFEARQKFNF